jgi:alpha-1,2-mannosyltransferase
LSSVPATRNHRGLLLAGLVVAAVAAGLYVAALATYPRIDMLKGFDLNVYRMGGLLAHSHPARLYSWQLRPGVQFTYTPFAALLFAGLSSLSLVGLMDGVAAVSALAFGATVWIACRELGLTRNARLGATLLVAGLAFWSQPVQRALFLGQIELVLMGVVVWDICQPDRRPWKGAAIGIAAGIKLIPLIFILYLLLTRRLRQAAVAIAAFAATILVGFAALSGDSVTYWLHGYFLRADRTGFVGRSNNQSLLGTIIRFAGSAAAGRPVWIVAATLVGVVGLGAATLLDRAGPRFEGVMVVALTALLISPISWDAHWVWVAPGLAVFVSAAVLATRRSARLSCAAAAAFLVAVFEAWPKFWVHRAGLLHGGLFWYAPTTAFGHGDNPAYAEYHWHGIELLAGNLYVFVGCALLLLVLSRVAQALSPLRRGEPMLASG